MDRKITVSLASHWPCITDLVAYPSTDLQAQSLRKGDEQPTTTSGTFYLYLQYKTTGNTKSHFKNSTRCRYGYYRSIEVV